MSKDKSQIVAVSPVPMYAQIKELLRARILDGSYRAHEQLPSENEMVANYGVSRITVRQALSDLQKEGLIFKIHGKGTFVSKPKAFQNVTRLQGFGEAMSSMGYETFSQLLGINYQNANRIVAKKLQISESDTVCELRRVRFLNREPISLDITYVSADIGRRLEKEDLASRDIFLILENEYGLMLDTAQLQIEAVLADETLSRLLRVEESAPILRIERLTSTEDGSPIDFEYLYYRGDAFQYRLTVERHQGKRAAPRSAK